jgi:DNA sulfur modification protein DndD
MSKVTFKGIGVQNLGPFRERQYIDLQVRSSRPIILVKALNGSGKTTLLTCLQVALYGAKALGNARTSDYEQLIRGLHRQDAKGLARVDLDIRIETDGERDDITVSREWSLTGSKLSERLSVHRDGSQDFQLCEDWDEYLDNILPAELVQLFLFDGEKIEALANPKTLPDMLRRATEAFLGIGGIDSLSKDLVAVERRALLHAKEVSSDYEAAREELAELERQHSLIEEAVDILSQTLPNAEQLFENARTAYKRFSAEAQRSGLSAYQQAAQIRAAEQDARLRVTEAAIAVREALADPLVPLAGLGDLWKAYETLWCQESSAKTMKQLLSEIERRDRRVLRELTTQVSTPSLNVVKQVLAADSKRYRATAKANMVLQDAPDPQSLAPQVAAAANRYRAAVEQLATARARLADLERKVAAIPQGEQLADLLAELEVLASAQSKAEAQLASIQQQLADHQSNRAHLAIRLNAARMRMSREFRGQAQDQKAIAAGQRTRSVLAVFKDRLLASKATWLSKMITEEFRGLMRKQRLVTSVHVDPDTYAVSIVGAEGNELPMERLSAGERQLLAVAVLSALIRERKGRFPVVVDTPLARLDRTHREALIRRFFAKVSHQVMVLSTDEEVEGSVFDEMSKYTSAAYLIEFSDERRSSAVGPLLTLAEH